MMALFSPRRAFAALALAACSSAGAAARAPSSPAAMKMDAPSMAAPSAAPMAAPGLMEEYERRLFPLPECAADQSCAQAQKAEVSLVDGQLRIRLEIHALARAVYPLPSLGGAQWSSFGKEPRFQRSPSGEIGLLVEAGVSKVELALAPAGPDVVLSFANAPKSVAVAAPGWRADIPAQGAVGTLRLTKEKTPEAARKDKEREQAEGAAAGAQFDAPLFIDERRVAHFDANGADIATTFRRLSPAAKPASAAMELMPGEKIVSEGGATSDGSSAKVDFGAGVEEVVVRTRREYKASMPLVAHARADRRETWVIEPWSKAPLKFDGLTPVNSAANSASLVFMPKPGEKLTMQPQQIIPATGAQIAVDRSELTQTVGEDKVEHVWALLARSTIAAPLEFSVPPGWRMDSATINGRPVGLSKKGSGYVVDLLPGANAVSMKFGQDRDAWWWTPSPAVSIAAPVANLKWRVMVPQNQWVVWTSGPVIGPAVLIWGVLAAMCALSYALSRKLKAPFAPSFLGWLGILVPLSALSPWSALAVVAFIFALSAKASNHHMIRPLDWNGVQLGLMLLGALSAIILLAGVYQGLLGTPDMMVRGGGSTAGSLAWYLDKAPMEGGFSQGLSAGGLLAPIWLWRAMMLAWALWMAAAVAKRLPAIWATLCLGGFWRKRAP